MKEKYKPYKANELSVSNKGGDTNQNITIINDLSFQLKEILSIYDLQMRNELIFESEGVFRNICNKAKLSAEHAYDKSDKQKLCYLIAVFILKSGLFFLLEKLYKDGVDFTEL